MRCDSTQAKRGPASGRPRLLSSTPLLAADSVLHQGQLLRAGGKSVAVALTQRVSPGKRLPGVGARGSQEVAAGVPVECVGGVDLVGQLAFEVAETGCDPDFMRQVLLVRRCGLVETAIGIHDERVADGEWIAQVFFRKPHEPAIARGGLRV